MQEKLHDSGIWQTSQCLWQENTLLEFFKILLYNQGYRVNRVNPKIWSRDDRTVIVCLVDDIRSCSQDYHTDLPDLYNQKTLVVTDNYITCPTRYSVLKLPDSFFGIYWGNNIPLHTWTPTKEFALGMNRADPTRVEIILELSHRINLSRGNVNFNCQNFSNMCDTDAAKVNFSSAFIQLSNDIQQKWMDPVYKLREIMPYCNYDFDFEKLHTSALINMVVETHSTDSVIALSEKTFRMLMEPSPWTLYSGRYSVARLKQLGFDVLDDIVDHAHYDGLKRIENKINVWVWKSLQTSKLISAGDVEKIRLRCLDAALHNRQILQHWNQTWAQDFAHWLPEFVKAIE